MPPNLSSKLLSRFSTRNIAVFFFFVIIIVSVFGSSLHYPFFSIDDNAHVTNNGDIRRVNTEMLARWFTRDYALLYTPATLASLAFDYHFWHLDPFGYRLTGLTIHLFNTFLVYLIILQLSGNWLLALGVGCMFGIHPVQVESVVWISERKNLLSAFFLLLAFHSYLFAKLRGTFFWFLLGVLSKPSIVTFPILLLFFSNWRSCQFSRKDERLALIVLCAIGLIISAVTFKNHAGTEIYFRGGTFLSNLYVMMTIFFKYIQLLVLPFHQQFFYMSQIYYSFWNTPVILAFLGICAITLWLAVETRKKSEISFWLAWYLVFLIPVSNVITPIGTLMNDRYLYIPLIGFFMVIFLLTKRASKNFFFNTQSGQSVAFTIIGLVILCASFGILSAVRVHDWRTSTSVLEADLAHTKYHDVRANAGRVTSLLTAGNIKGAIEEMDTAMKVSPNKDVILWQIQNYLEAKRFDDAFQLLKIADKFQNQSQRDVIEDFYGQYYFQTGKGSESEKAFQNAINLNNRKTALYVHLASLYESLKRSNDAIVTLRKALAVDPDSLAVLSQLCNIYLEEKDYKNAYAIYLELLKLYPNEPFVQNISNLMKAQSKP